MRRLLLCFVLLFVACGNGDNQAQDTAGPSATPASQVEECEDRTPRAPEKVSDEPEGKPDVEVPDGAPPCELVIQDIYEGKGTRAKKSSSVTVQYVGVSWSTGEQFDASWDSGQAITFPLSNVVKGWQDGIPGMREGGRRRLIIPPQLGYGSEGRPGIAPNETLIFVIDLIAVA